ncbi:MAG: glycosyltransferase family 4 protein [Acidimicrobiales bacterium]|nr:glycosyltransferase family 4 protein [Acidimicrobiales bacterium]
MASTPHDDDPLRIALLTYRGKKHCGGQGVYVRHLSKALTLLGHHVEVLSGPPYPETVDEVPLIELPSLEIYNDHFPMRFPAIWELKNWTDVAEVLSFSSGTFPEPLAFSLRAWDHLKHRVDEFDIVQDNQSMGYGLLGIERAGLPVLGTIHHPITVDRKLEMEHAETPYQRFAKGRWYAFTKMQSRVAQRLTRILTVSESSRGDIIKDHGVDPDRLHVVPVGVDPETFLPVPGVTPVPGRIITTASADVAMKGLVYLLEAVAKLRTENPDIHLVVIGKPKEEGRTARTLAELGLSDAVEFVSGVSEQRIVELYSESELAVVPSLYEGFSLPAIEAMSCSVCLVATTGGAIPEVVGKDGETALLVPPGDSEALAVALRRGLDDPDLRARIGAAGRQRIIERWSWTVTAEKTVEQYRARLAEPTISTQVPGLGELPSLPGLPSLDDVGGALAGLRRRLPV